MVKYQWNFYNLQRDSYNFVALLNGSSAQQNSHVIKEQMVTESYVDNQNCVSEELTKVMVKK